MLNALIVDDNENAREVLSNLISRYCKNVTIVTGAATVKDALQIVKTTSLDIVFLDVRIGDETGFDFLNAADNRNFSIVFTTAYEDYAFKALKYAPVYYLLKPIDVDELTRCINKIESSKAHVLLENKLSNILNHCHCSHAPNQLALNSKNEIEFINVADIIFCEADGFYTKFYLENNKEILVSKNLKEYEDILPKNFFRIHKSYLINRSKIKKIIKNDGGSLVMSNGKNLPISQRKKEIFMSHFLNAV